MSLEILNVMFLTLYSLASNGITIQEPPQKEAVRTWAIHGPTVEPYMGPWTLICILYIPREEWKNGSLELFGDALSENAV